MRGINKLTALRIGRLTKPGRYGDGQGLWLQISTSGTKSWVFRYMLGGRARMMGLGQIGTIGLAEARNEASDARRLLLRGEDPIEHRDAVKAAAKAKAAQGLTFEQATEKYIGSHRAGWKNAKHADQWRSTLETYAYPTIGDEPVSAIDTSMVKTILEPIWTKKTETASRVRGRIEAVLDWASASHYRTGDNPARWRGHLENVFPSRAKVRRVRHHPAMAFDDLPVFMAKLRSEGCVSARALEFTILTAVRTGETIGATRDEVDLVAKVWTIPGDRMKSGREHRVPLSERACEIIRDLPELSKNPHLFPGARIGRGLSSMAMLELLRGVKGMGLTVHGFRSSFRDWAAEKTNFPREIAEAALAHVLRDKTEAAYRRGDALEKRRGLMNEWEKFCAQNN